MDNIPKNYDKSRETEIFARWIEKGYFKAAPNPDKKPYTIMMPPPNITAQLHMGHALNNTVQDILIRFKRMQGYEALWLPGTDHAAIATEVVVINKLAEQSITKESLGRDAFLEKMWEWNEEYGGTIVNQLKKLGASADWDRIRFTMDDGLSNAVLETFVRLYNSGKIYKGERLVNWCVKCGTSISDAEVEHSDKEGALYHFKYPIEGTSEFIAFATTRPETMLGDTAIAVNPSDERYAALVGKFAIVPFVERKIPIIADHYVDKEYGTGVVKITPAHDPNDFEVGERHNLPRVNVMHDDGLINENGAHYAGLTREEARKKIIAEMDARGLYIKTEPLTHSVGEHDRCHTVVEPLLKLQWWVKMADLAKPALDAYENGSLKFNRDRFGRIYKNWLDNIRDWCISRQLWWGHRIPAWYDCEGNIYVAATAEEVEKQFKAFLANISQSAPGDTGLGQRVRALESHGLVQDEDVLDTWFSSALWPFSTLGWPEKTPELDYFYPGDVLVTDRGIIFNWVVRMVFMGIEYMGELPFTDVFINGTVQDEQGRKMSKSLGNGIDPLEVISEYGSDVLRLMLMSGNAVDSDTRFFYDRLDPARNALNKLWNATRFVLMNLDGAPAAAPALQMEDNWILSRLNTIIKEVTEKLDEHELGISTQKIVDFAWDEFCDWYVEMVKPRLYSKDESPETVASRAAAQATLRKVLISIVKLLHPVTPFITEDLFLALQGEEETIMLSQWPGYDTALEDSAAEKDIDRIKEAVRGIRQARAEKQVPPSQKIAVIIQPADDSTKTLYQASLSYFGMLVGAKDVVISQEKPPENAVSIVVQGATIYLPMDSLVDAEKEKARLEKEKVRLQQEIARIDGKLANKGFMDKAPENLIAAEREKRENFVAMLAKVEEEIG